jgi:hypothetical protein
MTPAAATPTSTDEALAMLTSALGYLAAADPVQMPAGEQAACLHALESADAIETAVRTRVLGAFTAAQGHVGDGDYSPRSWLIHKTRITKGTATVHTAWARRARSHPVVMAELATGEMSESWARTLCGWSRPIPDESRDAADEILIAAARAGMDLRDLAALAAELRARLCPPDDDDDGSFKDRGVRLETTFQGAGVLSGDLSPECAALVGTVLDALSVPAGAEDPRSQAERYHDGLQEAMRRLVAAGLLPKRAGQPVKVIAHITLADLMILDADSALQDRWTERVRAGWAGHRAATSVAGGDGGAWLEGDAAEGAACDGSITPVVFGEVNYAVLEDLMSLCIQLAVYRHGTTAAATSAPSNSTTSSAASAASGPATSFSPTTSSGSAAAGSGSSGLAALLDLAGASGLAGLLGPADTGVPAGSRGTVPAAGAPGTGQIPPGLMSRAALERAIIGKAVALVSGPGGLAGFLRRNQLGARLSGPSLPLDVGYSKDIPTSIRTAVQVRDQRCQWAGGCHQPAKACEVHHLRHTRRGGETSVDNCVLLCWFHHHVMIHRMGWTLVRHPDGTTMAWNREKTKVLRSHSPPNPTG